MLSHPQGCWQGLLLTLRLLLTGAALGMRLLAHLLGCQQAPHPTLELLPPAAAAPAEAAALHQQLNSRMQVAPAAFPQRPVDRLMLHRLPA